MDHHRRVEYMAAPPCIPVVTEQALQGFKYFRLLGPLFAHLHAAGMERDRAGNRQLFYEQYATLLLLYCFSPLVTSLRGLQQASTLAKVQQRLGVRQTALGSLSEAASVFDASLLHEVIAELGTRLRPQVPLAEQAALQHLTAIDGSLLPALPQMVWALWQDAQHRAAKRHVAVEVLRQVPVGVTVTAGNASERAELRRLVRPGGLYVMDRGYADDALFQALHDLPCRFLVRVQYNAAYEVQEELPVSAAAEAAGVSRDCLLRRLGTEHHTRLLPQPFRVVVLATDTTRPDGTPDRPVLVTNRLDLAAELVALAFRSRWSVELFFRWLTCVLGCRHLLSQCQNGVSIHVYVAMIASLLVSLWIGRPPTKRTYEMLCFSLSGWASEAEVVAHIHQLHRRAPPPCKS
jgi:Transposase DDE domain